MGKEADVKPQTGAPQHRDKESDLQVSQGHTLQTTPPPELSAEARAVLESLRKAGTGLTLRQLGSRVSLEAPILEDALGLLVDRRLVTRLNTIIPSYSIRNPGTRLHDQ
jgi:hypothetical protein